jgi:hypothetical protein
MKCIPNGQKQHSRNPMGLEELTTYADKPARQNIRNPFAVIRVHSRLKFFQRLEILRFRFIRADFVGCGCFADDQ